MKDPIFYHFSENKWIETKQPTQQDILLKIDRENKFIYFFEGNWSTPQQQMMAKVSLNAMKITYPTYKFRQITENDSELMQNTFKMAFLHSEMYVQKTQLKWILGILGLFELILLVILGSLLSLNLTSQLSSSIILIDALEFTRKIAIYTFIGLGCSILLIIHAIFALKANKYLQLLGIFCSLGLLFGLIIFWDLEISPIFELVIENNVILSGGKFWNITITSILIIGVNILLVIIGTFIPHRSSKNKPQDQALIKSGDRKEKRNI